MDPGSILSILTKHQAALSSIDWEPKRLEYIEAWTFGDVGA